jgi:hypothetical protein
LNEIGKKYIAFKTVEDIKTKITKMLSVIMLAVIKFHFPIKPPVNGNPIMDTDGNGTLDMADGRVLPRRPPAPHLERWQTWRRDTRGHRKS